jgi:dihydroneopterin aldolase
MAALARYHISGLRIHAPIGWFEEERLNGNDFLIDISYSAPYVPAAGSDELSDAVDYAAICRLTEDVFQKKCRLLEQIASELVNQLEKNFPRISHLKVKITKVNPPVEQSVEGISIELETEHERRRKKQGGKGEQPGMSPLP